MNSETGRLTDFQRQLAESHIGLARRIAWKYLKACERLGMDWDDVFSIACMGLMRAVRTFDPEKSSACWGCGLPYPLFSKT